MNPTQIDKMLGGSTTLGTQAPVTTQGVATSTTPTQMANTPLTPTQIDQKLGGSTSLNGNQPQNNEGFLQKVGDFFTGSTQKAGADIGQALASPGNTQIYNDSVKSWTDVTNNLLKAIKTKQDSGQDTTKLQLALIDQENSIPKIQDFQGAVFQKTPEQIIGDIAGSGLEALGGSVLESGADVATKGLSTLEKVGEGAKIGVGYGAAGGTINSLQDNGSVGDVVGGGLEGGLIGGVTGGGLGLLGAAGSGLVSKIGEYTNSEGLTKKLGDVYNSILNLTPKQQTLEGKFDQDAGAHMANLANEGTTLPLGHANGNLVTNQAQDILKNKFIQPENELLDKFVASEQKSVPWQQLKSDFLKTVKQYTGSDADTATTKINKELSAYENQYKDKFITMADGSKNIKLEDVNQMRRDFWAKAKPAFNSTNDEKLQANVFNKLGHVARDTVLKNTDSNLAGNLLKRLGDHQHLLQILQERNNKPIGMSVIKQYIAKFGLGAIGDMVAGHGGGMIGYWSGARLAHLLDNPNIDTSIIRALLDRQPIKDPVILKNINEILNVREQAMNSRLQLEAPAPLGSAKNPILAGAESKTTFEPKAQNINRQFYPDETKMLPAPSGRVDNAIPVAPRNSSIEYTGKNEMPSTGYATPNSSKPPMNPQVAKYYSKLAKVKK